MPSLGLSVPALVGVLLLLAARASDLVPTEVIDLDLPPEERWRDFALRHRDEIVAKSQGMGVLYERALGPAVAARWMAAAPVSEELLAEYRSFVKYVDHPDVTLQRLVLTDMWHAVGAPTFACTGLLAATPNGTVIHGRNVDYESDKLAEMAERLGVELRGGGGFYDGIFLRGGQPVVSFVGSVGNLGIHTGMRIGAWSWNSNARIAPNNMTANLLATESGSLNFPWVSRKYLLEIPDFASAVQAFSNTSFNAPNYFILAGAGSYEGVVITADRGGRLLPGTPAVQSLSAERGVWHLVQTNDDQLEPPLDARRGAALTRLARSPQSQVSMDFVERQMLAEPTTNSDTLLTWIANPGAGTHKTIPRSMVHVMEGLASKLWHKAMHLPMPQDLPPTKRPPGAKAQGSSFLHLG
mmetsp:Transcript_61446/g.190843  ORF Transcript_61446/g.190843 Transcript_61446/m.190843 type:complete len:411 (+) Transcript_61446:89-1321(+)